MIHILARRTLGRNRTGPAEFIAVSSLYKVFPMDRGSLADQA
jgi:hypothetical protein